MFKRQKQHKASILIIAVLISGIVYYAQNREVIGNENGVCLWCKLQSEERSSPAQRGSGEGRGCRREEEAGVAMGALVLANCWGTRWALAPTSFSERSASSAAWHGQLCLLLSLEAGALGTSAVGGGCWQGCRALRHSHCRSCAIGTMRCRPRYP